MTTNLLGLPEGIYKGFTYTDESPICYGELELLVENIGLKIRIATGHEIREEVMPADQLLNMQSDKIASKFHPGTRFHKEALAGKIIGIEGCNDFGLLFDPGYLKLTGLITFIQRVVKKEAGSLTLFSSLQSWGVPPDELYGPTKAQHDTFNARVKSLLRNKDFFPQLEHDGKMSPEYYNNSK